MKGPLLQFDGWPPRIGLHGTRPRYQTRGSSVSTLGHSRLFTTQVSTLALGSQDEDYPFACPPGVRGSQGNADEIETQISPVCVGACPAGSMCSSATHTPQRTPHIRTSEPQRSVPRYCLLIRAIVLRSLHGRHLLPERLGRGDFLPTGDCWPRGKPHLSSRVRYLPRWPLLHRRRGQPLRPVDLQPTGRPISSDGMQAVPKERCDQRHCRHLGHRMRVCRRVLQPPPSE